jgi:predicted AlkP superfamily pyrophosphatase or phosphodiesterase
MSVRKRALIIGIDGCRPDARAAAHTPYMDALIAEGAYSDLAQTGEHTDSAPGWSHLLTGVWHSKHGVRDNSFGGSRFHEYPHFFRRLKEWRSDLITASIVNWEPINGAILSHADFAQSFPSDAEVAAAAARYLSAASPDALFLQFDEVDSAGHKHGYAADSPGYLASIAQTDAQIGQVLNAMRSRKAYSREDWLVLVSTDHGGSERGHGRNVPEHRTIFLIVSGEAAARGEIRPAPQIVDDPATVAAHLGVEVAPAWGWEGRPVGLR